MRRNVGIVASAALAAMGGASVARFSDAVIVADFTTTASSGQPVVSRKHISLRGYDQVKVVPDSGDGPTIVVNHATANVTTATGTHVYPQTSISPLGISFLPWIALNHDLTTSTSHLSRIGSEQNANGTSERLRMHRDSDYGAAVDYELSVDNTTHLLNKIAYMRPSIADSRIGVEIELTFDNYKPVQGVMVPYTITQTIRGRKAAEISVVSVTFDNGLTDSDFEVAH